MTTCPVLETVRVRRDFLAAAQSGLKEVRYGLVLQACRHEGDVIRFGLTATKKIGNAVIRNRTRRRLRALSRDILPHYGQAGFDYILIGRVHTRYRPYRALTKDLTSALKKIHQQASACHQSEGIDNE